MYSKDYYDSTDYKPERIGIEIFQKMSQYMPYMVFIMRAADFKLLYANRKVSEFLGFNLDDLHNMDGRIGDMLAEDEIDVLLDTAQKIQHIDDDQALKIRIKLKSKDGSIVHLEIFISVFKRDENHTPSEYFCVSEDITEKMVLEARAQELERINRLAQEAKVEELARAYDEVEQFSYIASHDLQEPLRKIRAFSQRIQDKCGAGMDEECQVYINRIIDGTNRMRLLIENLLMLSRTKGNAEYFEPTNLNHILSDVMLDLENRIAAKSAVIHLADLPVIEAIPIQMQQLFQNLLTNSLKFSRENVDAIIHLSCTFLHEKQKNEYKLDTQQDYVYIQLQDNGIGFDPAHADIIFSPFKRLHGRSEYEGTGIGLAICRKVVQNHGGLIWADSKPGLGATFHIILATRRPGLLSP